MDPICNRNLYVPDIYQLYVVVLFQFRASRMDMEEPYLQKMAADEKNKITGNNSAFLYIRPFQGRAFSTLMIGYKNGMSLTSILKVHQYHS